jgi:predicted RNA-binding protein YlxR (DUF448 family)
MTRSGKDRLLRFVVRAGVLVIDQTGQLPGRGAYSCRRQECLKKLAARKGRLTKALRQEVVDCRVVMSIVASGCTDEPGPVCQTCRDEF